MRTALLLILWAMLGLGAASALAQKWEDDLEHVDENRCGGSIGNTPFFTAYLEAGAIRTSPDLDLANRKLPKTLKEIAEVAFAKLESILGTREGWRLSSLQLFAAGQVFPVGDKPAFARKFYYIVGFTDGAYGGAAIPVTLDGRVGVVVTKKDEAKAPRLPFD